MADQETPQSPEESIESSTAAQTLADLRVGFMRDVESALGRFTSEESRGEESPDEFNRFVNEIFRSQLSLLPGQRLGDLLHEMRTFLDTQPTSIDAATYEDWNGRLTELDSLWKEWLQTLANESATLVGPATAFVFCDVAHTMGKTCTKIQQFLQIARDDPSFLHFVVGIEEDPDSSIENDPLTLAEHFGVNQQGMRQEKLERRFEAVNTTKTVSASFVSSLIQKFASEEQGNATAQGWRAIPLHMNIDEAVTALGETLPRGVPLAISTWELVLNARKVMRLEEQGDSTSVRMHMEGTTLVIEVSDNGPGLPDGITNPEDLFDEGVTNTEEAGGSGFGLPFLRKDMDRLFGGTVTAALNDPDEGMTFTIRIPLTE